MLAGLLHKIHTRRLQEALKRGDAKRLQMAIRKGANLDQPFKPQPASLPEAPVIVAIRQAQPDCLALLLNGGAKPPESDPQGEPLLNLAIATPSQSLQLLSLLLQAGLPADLSDELRDQGRELPLFACLRLPEPQVMLHISRLVQYGADLNRLNTAGESLLHQALLAGQQALVASLVSSGAQLPKDLDRLPCAENLKALAKRCYDDLQIRRQLHPF